HVTGVQTCALPISAEVLGGSVDLVDSRLPKRRQSRPEDAAIVREGVAEHRSLRVVGIGRPTTAGVFVTLVDQPADRVIEALVLRRLRGWIAVFLHAPKPAVKHTRRAEILDPAAWQ